jgi:hypothetical protein
MLTTFQLRGATLEDWAPFCKRPPLSPKSYDKVMSGLRRWRRESEPAEEERRALENWVRLRFQLAASDPMLAIIGAVGRLTDAGMTQDDATDTVLRILHEKVTDEPASG